MANLRKYRDIIRLLGAVLFFWLYIPHIAVYILSKTKRDYINSDLEAVESQVSISLSKPCLLLYLLHNNAYYRSLFYKRVGAAISLLIGWWRPGDRYFIISKTMKLGKGCWFAHPYSTVLNAESIGDHFRCIHLTTIGDSSGKRPVLGNNVNLGANVTIVGNVRIGDNVTIGAGSVVVKDIPSNSVAVGVPAKVVKIKKV